MKILAVACLLFAASQLTAQTAPAAKATDATTPAVPLVKDKAAPTKKKEVLPKIPGMEIARSNGTFLGLEVMDGKFKLTFYDKKKKPTAIDVTRATARWPNTRSSVKAFNRSVLNPAGRSSLIGSTPALPPFTGSVFINLLQGEGEDAKVVETYSVAFRG